jgi:hypothetical protein
MGKIQISMDSLKSGRDWVRHKINDGSNVFRILPPFGDPETHRNWPFRKWSVAWLQDPKSGKRKPFATPMTDGEACPVQEYVDALNKYVEEKKAGLKAEGYSDGDIKAELEGLRSIQWNVRVQHLYAYNACDKSGTVGLLELKSTAHKAMKKMMNQYIKDYAQDPTSLESEDDDSGVWFNITKDGKGKDTEYSVAFNQTREKDDKGRLVKIDDRSPLPENVVTNYSELGYDLSNMYTSKSYDELKEILLFNIALLAEEIPEATLDTYDISDINVNTATVKKASKTSHHEEEEEVEEVKPTVKKTPAKAVALNLAEDDDEDETPVRKPTVAKPAAQVAKPAAKKAPVQQQFEDDELSALTAEILGD